MRRARQIGSLLLAALVLAGCGNGRPSFSLDPASVTPDEFSVLPSSPLEAPPDATALPVPEPGAANRTDFDFNQRRAEAFGGRGSDAAPTEDEAALLAALRRSGTPADPLVTGDVPIDPWAERERLIALGVSVPPAPPRGGQ